MLYFEPKKPIKSNILIIPTYSVVLNFDILKTALLTAFLSVLQLKAKKAVLIDESSGFFKSEKPTSSFFIHSFVYANGYAGMFSMQQKDSTLPYLGKWSILDNG